MISLPGKISKIYSKTPDFGSYPYEGKLVKFYEILAELEPWREPWGT